MNVERFIHKFFTISKQKTKELWEILYEPQREAICKMIKYINKYRSEPNEENKKSALVQMPTGSGKSGVITILASCIKGIGLTLVLTPRKILRQQISNDINGRFFKNIGFDPNQKITRKAINIEKGTILRGLEKSIDLKNTIIVMTFKMLSIIYDDKKVGFYQTLLENTSLILVDEGHYEPATFWSKCTREIKAPKILFTATPFRNDFHVFDIVVKNIYAYTFQEAVESSLIRKIKLIERPKINSPTEFVEDVIFCYENFKDKLQERVKDDPPRIIIRCDDSHSIEQLVELFNKKGFTCIGIHETFKNESWRRKDVPKVPGDEKAFVWIHQFKLLEGIDDSRFQVLAIYEEIRNARSLVQQIGRITRNPGNPEGVKGYFLDHSEGFHKRLWDGFLEYDRKLGQYGPDIFYYSTGDLIEELMKLQPKMAYVGKRFCFPLSFERDIKIDFSEDIQVPLKVNIIKKLDHFSLNNFVDSIITEYKNEDRKFRDPYFGPTGELAIIISIKCRNSPFLRNYFFLEADLYIIIIREFEEYLGIYDSSGRNWRDEKKLGLGHSIDVEKLKKLFHKENARLSTVSLSNSNLGTSVIRSHTITAKSIEETIPNFDDHAQICTTAEGYNTSDKYRQYVGFTRGRVSRYKKGYVPLPEYIEWLNNIHTIIDGRRQAHSIFFRYAQEKQVPDNPAPRCILLDIEEIKDVYFTLDTNEELYIEDKFSIIKNDKVQFKFNNKRVYLKIKFDLKSNKYKLSDIQFKQKEGTPAEVRLSTMFYPKKEEFPQSIIKYFNKFQSFIVLPEELDTVYVKGQFYSPKMRIGDDFNKETYALGNSIIVDNKIGKCPSEKGPEKYYKTARNKWYTNSLFDIISTFGKGTTVETIFNNSDILICDDMGIEIADFILCNTDDPCVIFIHAKATKDTVTKCSASKLHDVCAQAIKNLGYLAMFNDFEPSKLGSWDKNWNLYESHIPRICKTSKTYSANSLWDEIRKIINNPVANKEVWLFIGNILSKEKFESELQNPNPAPNVIQAAYLLHATMSEVASVGAKFRVFCKD